MPEPFVVLITTKEGPLGTGGVAMAPKRELNTNMNGPFPRPADIAQKV